MMTPEDLLANSTKHSRHLIILACEVVVENTTSLSRSGGSSSNGMSNWALA
uniref:Uncharacterized protein n=1 Tax=Arundo donax TaxID=35708 RepID=A0A0A8Z8I9_ARUDO